jgi:hypothetical protein
MIHRMKQLALAFTRIMRTRCGDDFGLSKSRISRRPLSDLKLRCHQFYRHLAVRLYILYRAEIGRRPKRREPISPMAPAISHFLNDMLIGAHPVVDFAGHMAHRIGRSKTMNVNNVKAVEGLKTGYVYVCVYICVCVREIEWAIVACGANLRFFGGLSPSSVCSPCLSWQCGHRRQYR